MTDLSINLNKIALIRNSRVTASPSVVKHAHMCIAAGADGITVHPRPDQRHIRASDCYELAEAIDVELNIEGNPFAPAMKSNRSDVGDYPSFMQLVREIKPAQCTLVPDTNEQLTSDHGFDLSHSGESLKPIIDELRSLNIRVSLFMDPEPEQIKLAAKLGAHRIELYTEAYADAVLNNDKVAEVVNRYVVAASAAKEVGLGVNAGHDLNLSNLPQFTAAIPHLLEVSIGHAFTVDCIAMGLPAAVTAYQHALGKKA